MEISIKAHQKKKLKIDLLYDPTVPYGDNYVKESKPTYKRDSCTHIFMTALLKITEMWNQPVPSN
jgi:hypothetical protein